MNYEELLLKEIADAKGETGVREALIGMIDPDTIKQCSYLGDIEVYQLDSLAVKLIIECRNNNSLFKAIRLDDSNLIPYRESVKKFEATVAFVQKASDEPIHVKIPMRPRDKLYEAVSVLQDLGYDNQILRYVVELVPTGRSKMPRRTSVADDKFDAFVNSIQADPQLDIFNNLPIKEK